MKALGVVLVLFVLVSGGGIIGNLMTELAETECRRHCPEAEDAVHTVFLAGPVEVAVCQCPGDTDEDAGWTYEGLAAAE